MRGAIRRKTIKDILLERKLIDEQALAKATEEAKRKGQPLQQALIELGLVAKADLLRTLSQEWNVKAVDLMAMEIDPEVIKTIPEATARRHLAVPFAKEETILFVAMADPRDFFVSEDIHLRTGFEVQAYLAMPDDIQKCLDKGYGGGESEVLDKILLSVGKEEGQPSEGLLQKVEEEKVDISEVDASAPEVEKLVNAIILGALSMKASDIHIEPFENKILVRYRVDGVLREANFAPPWSYRNAIMAKLKIMTNQMDITERRKPQDGRIQLLSGGRPVEFRVNVVPTVFGESCVMRILDRSAVQVGLEQLGFLPDTLEKFKESIQKPYGLILVCGPTGSGKSTTLYSALNFINAPDTKILTAENPVEYNLAGIVQVNINQDIGFDFALALRAFLRQDPDVIMVGEIRDKETAQIALEAAMTGHLVFSTIHTNDAAGAVARLHEMGIPTFLVSSTVECVLAQRLIRKVCKNCKEPMQATQEMLDYFKSFGIPPDQVQLAQGKGCDTCKNSGFKGRSGIHELLIMDNDIRNLTLTEIAAEPINQLARSKGMRPILTDGIIKVTQGVTTLEEVLRVCQ